MNIAPLLCAALLAAAPAAEIDFDTEIVPILTKAGCNAGACHGAAAGRGGFHLSLLGGDAEADFEAIVHEFEGRRVNLQAPEESLLLAKPTGFMDHGGGLALDPESEAAKRLIRWIKAGAPRGPNRRLTKFEVSPAQAIVELGSDAVTLRAFASFDNGPMVDVTEDVLFTAADSAAVELAPCGSKARVLRSGQQIVIARYLDRVVPIELLVPFAGNGGNARENQANTTEGKTRNFIDEEIEKTLKTLRIAASPPASDAEFLRRVSLDLTGRLPSLELAREFPNDPAPDKREKLVDALLASEAFNEYWTLRWAKTLRIRALPNDLAGPRAYANWIHEQVRRNAPLSEMAAALLTATGDSHQVGPANFARMVADARAHAELAGRVFLGVRMECANCHNHPLDRWTQDDFHGFAAVFAKLERGKVVKATSRGGVTNLRTGEPATPRIPGVRFLEGVEDHRFTVAKWLVESEERQFARAMANRLWAAVMGRGLIEPVDDMRDTNPPTHPTLLNRLAEELVDSGYDARKLLRRIVLSDAYARRAAALPESLADDRFYSHAYPKPLLPEVLADAVGDVTGVFNDYGESIRAAAAVPPPELAPSLVILGACNRPEGCEPERSTELGLAAQLHFLNGRFINSKLAAESGRLQKLLLEKRSNTEIVEEFFLCALSRRPTETELAGWLQKLETRDEQDRRERLEDFVWALLSSRAFLEIR